MPDSPTLDTLRYTDDLTGLPNRRFLYKEIERNPRDGWIHLIRVEALHEIGSRFGKPVAEAVLQELAKVLVKMASDGNLGVRYGSEEFALFLSARSTDQPVGMARILQAGFAGALPKRPEDDQTLPVTLSIGIAPLEASRSLSMTLREARQALTAARSYGSSQIVLSTGSIGQSIEHDPFMGFPCPVMVGRDAAIESLVQAAALPRVVLVHSAPGFGKTRFLQEAVKALQSAGALCGVAGADGSSLYAPLRVIGECLERMAIEQPQVRRRAPHHLAPSQRDCIFRFAPSVLGVEAGPPGEMPPIAEVAGASLALFDSVRDEFRQTVLAIDDAHYADGSSCDALAALLRTPVPLTILIASGDPSGAPEDVPDAPLASFVTEMRARRLLREIHLSPLDVPSVTRIVDAILPGRPPAPALDATLTATGGGSPTYVAEALRAMLLSGKILLRDRTWLIPPLEPSLSSRTLPHWLATTLRSLPAATRELVNHAAVLGGRLDIDLLQESLGWKELQMLEALDVLINCRFLTPMNDRSMEVFRFSSTHAHKIIHDAQDMSVRKQIHGRVGTVLGAHEEELLIHSQTSFSLDRRGVEDEARSILDPGRNQRKRLVPGARIIRIPDATDALPPAAIALLDTALRALLGAVKMGRIYPDNSQIRTEFQAQLESTLDRLLSHSPTVTLKRDGTQLKFNNVPVEIRRGGAHEEWGQVMDSRLISVMTFQRPISPVEITALVNTLISPFNRTEAPLDYWDQWLNREKIVHIDVTQAAFVAQEGASVGRLQGGISVERLLDPESFRDLALGLRYLKATLDSLKLYPRGHVLVEESLKLSHDAFSSLLARHEIVTLSSAEGNALVNGKITDAKDIGLGGQWFSDEITARDLKSLTWTRGLSIEELRTLAEFFALPTGDASTRQRADELVQRADVTRFTFGARVFQKRETLTESEAADANVAPAEIQTTMPLLTTPLQPPSRRARADLKARLILSQEPAALTQGDVARGFLPLLETLNFGAHSDMATQLVQQLMVASRSGSPNQRIKALEMAGHACAGASVETRRLLSTHCADPLKQSLLDEADPLVLKAVGDTLPQWMLASLSVGSLKSLLSVFKEGFGARRASPTLSQSVQDSLGAVCRQVVESRAMSPLLNLLIDGSREQRSLASEILSLLGAAATASIIQFMIKEKDFHARRSAAEALATLGPEAVGVMIERLRSITSQEFVNLLEVMEVLGPDAIEGGFPVALQHTDASVREAAGRLALRARTAAVPALRGVLQGGLPESILVAVKLAHRMHMSALSPDVARVIETTDHHEAIRVCCRFIAELPTSAALSGLARIIRARAKLFQKGFPDEIRAEAAAALARVPGESARAILSEASRDPSPAVRAAAGAETAGDGS